MSLPVAPLRVICFFEVPSHAITKFSFSLPGIIVFNHLRPFMCEVTSGNAETNFGLSRRYVSLIDPDVIESTTVAFNKIKMGAADELGNGINPVEFGVGKIVFVPWISILIASAEEASCK